MGINTDVDLGTTGGAYFLQARLHVSKDDGVMPGLVVVGEN